MKNTRGKKCRATVPLSFHTFRATLRNQQYNCHADINIKRHIYLDTDPDTDKDTGKDTDMYTNMMYGLPATHLGASSNGVINL
jgi:hypothetical protein